jgi:hypothetical protein
MNELREVGEPCICKDKSECMIPGAKLGGEKVIRFRGINKDGMCPFVKNLRDLEERVSKGL